jgi:1-acyl-sn-glycerol-3-phosphate acyltransferase
MKRETIQKLSEKFFNYLSVLKIEGYELIPPKGGIIVTCNHLSRLDIPLLGIIPNRRDLIPLVADKYLEYPLLKWFIRSVNGIWLDRSKADFTAFKAAIDVIKQGTAIGIAPEGTRSTTGVLLEGKSGTVLLAMKTDAPLVPVGIFGTENGFSDLRHFRRPKITARFGLPYRLPPYDRNHKEFYMKTCTDEVMCRIAALLPDKYHGFYRGHPRIDEIRQGKLEFPVGG